MKLLRQLSAVRQCVRASEKCLSQVGRAMSHQTSPPPLSQVIQYLNSFAPLSLAESWDNVGLLVEPTTPVPIKKVLLTIDLTEEVVKEAVDTNANLIIAYHPPIFQSLKRITSGKWKERIVAKCLEEKIAVFSPHTSWDAVSPGGLSDWLASPFDFGDISPLTPSSSVMEKKNFSHQLTIFSPLAHADKCREFISLNKAEIISTASLDSMIKFNVIAQRQFLPELENALNETNSYYSIHERTAVPPKGCGTGRFGHLKSPITLTEAVDKMKKLVGMAQIRIALQKGKTLDSTVASVALVAGSGASVLRGVKADLFVTGEMLHHDLLEANHSGASVILLNHSDSERGFLAHFAPRLVDHFGTNLSVSVAKTDKDPIVIV